MKILHLCLSCFYIDGYSYQENQIVAQNVKDGHDVFVVASTETFNEDRELAYVTPSSYMGTDNAPVVRLPYRGILPHFLMRKLRAYEGLYPLLERIDPDVILFHGMCAWELLTTAKFVKNNPRVTLYVDSHEDFNNSARSVASKFLLHGAFYRTILRSALPYIEKVLCISTETINFARDFYRVPEEKIEFFPLGGKVFDDKEYIARRNKARDLYDVRPDEVLFVQSGKMDASKKLIDSLTAFSAVPDPSFRFVVVGHIQNDILEAATELIERDSRIRYVGWKDAEALQDILCGADVYLQPGTQSATMQMSLCCRCAVILDDVESHRVFVKTNGWLINESHKLEDIVFEVSNKKSRLPDMSKESFRVAQELLDYGKLSARLYS